MIRIAIASGHTLLREGLDALLDDEPTVQVVGQAATSQALTDHVSEDRPDVILLDPRLPEQDVVQTIRGVCDIHPECRVLVMDRRPDGPLGLRALRAGALGLLDGSADTSELTSALRTVHGGGRHLPPVTQATLAEMFLDPNDNGSPADMLSEREFQVMCLLASGESSRETAERLQISVKTVDSHRGNLLKKLGLRNNADLARFALAHGYVDQ